MHSLPLSIDTLLVIGAHSDDGEIGCGGTVLQLIAANPDIDVTWVVVTGTTTRQTEARESADALLAGAKSHRVICGTLRDGFLPYLGAAPKEFFESVAASCNPDLILTHSRDDLHQDHRICAELTRNTWRSHFILEYEVPKWDGDLGRPNTYVPIDQKTADRKVAHLMNHFASQRSKTWFTEDTFRGLMRIRGIECASPSGLAEAYFAPKVSLTPTR